MASLTYSTKGLDTLALFHRSRLVVYVEGKDDRTFWDTALRNLGVRDFYIGIAGGVEEIEKYTRSIIEDGADIVVAAGCTGIVVAVIGTDIAAAAIAETDIAIGVGHAVAVQIAVQRPDVGVAVAVAVRDAVIAVAISVSVGKAAVEIAIPVAAEGAPVAISVSVAVGEAGIAVAIAVSVADADISVAISVSVTGAGMGWDRREGDRNA